MRSSEVSLPPGSGGYLQWIAERVSARLQHLRPAEKNRTNGSRVESAESERALAVAISDAIRVGHLLVKAWKLGLINALRKVPEGILAEVHRRL